MKLVKIKDVRIGQVWKEDDNDIFIITGFSEYEPEMIHCVHYVPEDKPIILKSGKKVTGLVYSSTSKNMLEKSTLIGKIGITHRIEDGRLVEIPPLFKDQKINIDDIVKVIKDGSFSWLVDTTYNARKYTKYISLLSYHDCDFSEDEVEKIGILGVTHEFVNNREAEFNGVKLE